MAAFQSTLTDFSSAYRPATGLYFGAPIWQLTATGSGSSSSIIVAFVTKAKQGTGSGVGSATAVGVRIVGRTATGSGVSDAITTRTNLVPNPSFETDTTGWAATSSAGSLVRSSTYSLFGSYSAERICTGSGNANLNRVFGHEISVSVGQTYAISAYVRSTISRNCRVVMNWYTSANSFVSQSIGTQIASTTIGFTRVSVNGTVPATATKGLLFCQALNVNAGESHYWDGVLIETGSTLLPYFDGTYADTYTGYALTSQSWSGTVNASTSTTTFRPTTAHKVTQLRLGALTDFSFPYLTGGRFYLGPAYYLRTASASGTGSQSTVSLHIVIRSATGSGSAGASTSTDLEILFRSATGSGTSSGEADPFLFVIRQASGSGSGTSSSVFRRELLRPASGTGAGASSANRLVKNLRTASGSGVGSGTAVRLVVTIRSATASGVGTASSTSIELLPRTASGSGAGATSGDAIGYKFHMFRPPTQNDVPTQLVGGDRIANRLARFYAPGQRGKNVYKLTDSTFTEIDQHDYSIVTKVYHGGHVHQLTEEEYTDLLAAGYSEYLT